MHMRKRELWQIFEWQLLLDEVIMWSDNMSVFVFGVLSDDSDGDNEDDAI